MSNSFRKDRDKENQTVAEVANMAPKNDLLQVVDVLGISIHMKLGKVGSVINKKIVKYVHSDKIRDSHLVAEIVQKKKLN